jgi:hypothetical protein
VPLPQDDIAPGSTLPLYAPNTVYTTEANPNNPHVTYPPIPEVPMRTPLVDANGMITRTWMRYFQRVFNPGSGGSGGPAGPWQRTLLVKDTTVGSNIADHVTIFNQAGGTCILVTGTLTNLITADLTMRLNLTLFPGSPQIVGQFTIPAATPLYKVIQFAPATFTLDPAAFPFLAVLSWDILASDGSMNSAGVASYTVEWQ